MKGLVLTIRRLASLLLVSVAATTAAIPAAAGAEVGGFDPLFGSGNGRALLPAAFIDRVSVGEDLAIGPADEILVLRRRYGGCPGSDCGTDLYLERIDSDGTVDTGYGARGVSDLVSIAAAALPRSLGASVQITPEGKPLVVDSDGTVVTMARFLSDGRLDPGFGVGGISRSDFGGAGIGLGVRAAIDRNGRIVVATETGPAANRLVLARYLPDGRLDPEFAAGAGYEFQPPPISPGGLALFPGGGIVVGGNACCTPVTRRQVDLSRWLPNGEGSGNGFPRRMHAGPYASVDGVFALTKGRVEVVGASSRGAFIARFRRDGRMVRGFGRHGIARLGLFTVRKDAIQAVVDGRGRTLVVGITPSAESEGFGEPLLTRRLADGRVDPNFRGTGLGFAYPLAIALDSRGRVVVLGAPQCLRGCSGELVIERIVGRRS